jgi:hypothetical protein
MQTLIFALAEAAIWFLPFMPSERANVDRANAGGRQKIILQGRGHLRVVNSRDMTTQRLKIYDAAGATCLKTRRRSASSVDWS